MQAEATIEMLRIHCRSLQEERDEARRQLAVAREALEEIAESTRWGEDTAIKRTITMHQDTAREALAKIGGSDA